MGCTRSCDTRRDAHDRCPAPAHAPPRRLRVGATRLSRQRRTTARTVEVPLCVVSRDRDRADEVAAARRGRGHVRATERRARYPAPASTECKDETRGAITPRSEWWSMLDLNQRPPACEAGALPTELIDREGKYYVLAGTASTDREADVPENVPESLWAVLGCSITRALTRPPASEGPTAV